MSQFLLVLNLSLRNLWRQRRRNSFLLLAITVAVGGVIVLNSMIRGMQVQMVDQIVNSLTGHVKVLAPGYRDDPNIENSFTYDVEKFDRVLETMPLQGWTERVVVPAVVMSERETRGIQLVGIQPDREQISFISSVVLDGEFLQDSHDSRIFVGRDLVEQLRTKIGRRIVVIAQGSDGISEEIGFRIAGIYDASSNSLERQFMFTGIDVLQRMLNTNNVTELSVRFTTRYDRPEHLEQIRQHFPQLEVLSWQQQDPLVAFMYRTVDIVIYLWLMIVLGALVFGLANTLITAVLERTQEFGLFRAIGMRPKLILSQVVVESLTLMILGIGIGFIGSALIFVWLGDAIDLSQFTSAVDMIGMSPQIIPAVIAHDVVIVVVISIALSLVASFYPALRAVRMDPLDALRY